MAPKSRQAAVVVLGLGAAALPAPLLHAALAATAGTLFEAAPFVLALALVRGNGVRPLAALLGCGCGAAAGPAALSLPTAALCWMTFGPAVALGRLAAAWLARGWFERRHTGDVRAPDPLRELAALAGPAFALGLGTALLQSGYEPPVRVAPAFVPALEIALGLFAGAFAPCTTAAVALAAMLRVTAPFAAAGMLVSAGLVPPLRPGRTLPAAYDARLGLALLCAACLWLALRGGSGFVHPRLVPLVWLAIPGAGFAFAKLPASATRFGALAPAAMLAALVFGSPLPATRSLSATLDDVYPGEPVAFIGAALTANGRTVLVRYAITCCRADATALVLPADRRLPVERDAWLRIRGTIAQDATGTFVRVRDWQRVVPPSDPYLYR
jgi:hypothetical protein